MAAWTHTFVSLSDHRNSSISSKPSPHKSQTTESIWHPCCSTKTRSNQMKRAAGLLAIVLLPALLHAQVVAYDYSGLYEQVSPAVVTVTTDDGSGSGFLASSSGLIATNHHVVRNTRYLAVQFADGRKVQAKVVAVNPFHDMALLKVNSEVVS